MSGFFLPFFLVKYFERCAHNLLSDSAPVFLNGKVVQMIK